MQRKSLLLETSSTAARARRFSQLTEVCSFLPVCIAACARAWAVSTHGQPEATTVEATMAGAGAPALLLLLVWALSVTGSGQGQRAWGLALLTHTAACACGGHQRTEGRETVPAREPLPPQPGFPNLVVLAPRPLRGGVRFARE